MAKTRAPSSTPEPIGSPDIPAEMNAALLSAVATAMEAGAKVWFDWQEEMSRFVATRVEADLKLQQALVGCRDVGEVAAIQQEWATATARHYLDGVTRLSRFPSSLASGTATPQPASTPISSEARHAAE